MSLFAKEVGNLREIFNKTKIKINETIDRKESLEVEYEDDKNNYDSELINIESEMTKIDFELSELENKEEELTYKMGGEEFLIKDYTYENYDLSDELNRMKREDYEMFKKNNKLIKELKNAIQKEEKILKYEEEMQFALEKSFENRKVKKLEDFDLRLKNHKKIMLEKMNDAERRFLKKKKPLINHMNELDSKIDSIEKEIAAKPNELKALEKREMALEKKLIKLSYRE